MNLGGGMSVFAIASLAEIGALPRTDGNFIVGDGSSWVAESGNTARTSLGLGTADSPTFTDIFGSGTFGSGTALPISGAGTKAFWYSKKAAFRVGRVTGAEWDDGNIGNYSFAGGKDSEATGDTDFAYGDSCVASGGPSIAIGYFCEAKAFGSTALGENHDITTSGFYSVALGSTHTISKTYGFAGNYRHTVSADYAAAFGNWNLAQSFNAFYAGRYCVAAGTPGSWVSTEPLFVLGNGTSSGARNNAFTIFKDGNILMDGDTFSANGALNFVPVGEFSINTTAFSLDKATGDVAIGQAASSNVGKFDIVAPLNDYGLIITAGTVQLATYNTSAGAWFGTRSDHSLNIFIGDSGIHHAFDISGNFICGNNDTGSVASGAASAFILSAGILGSAMPNAVQMTAEDITSGNTTLALQTEGTGIHTTGIGSPAGDSEVILKINGTDVHLAGNSVARTNTVNLQTGTTYTITATDMVKLIRGTNAAAVTFTLPEDSTENLNVGFECFVAQGGAGQITFATQGSDVIHSADGLVKTRVIYSGAYIKKVASGVYYIQGDLTA